MSIALRALAPTGEYAAAFLGMCQEYAAWGEKDYSRIRSLEDARERIARERAWEAGKVPPGMVPSSAFWFLDESWSIVGTGRIRPVLNERFRNRGGHAGFDVRPTMRKNGYGTYILGFLLRELQATGLDRALLTCLDDNVASWRVIEKNNGILEGLVYDAGTDESVRRYWVGL
jgi:predicted acetyltransferase